MSASLNLLLTKHGLAFLEDACQDFEGRPSNLIRDDANYRAGLVSEAWQRAPMQIRLFDPDALRWPQLLLSLRDRVFDSVGSTTRLRPGWKAALAEAVEDFALADDSISQDAERRMSEAGSKSGSGSATASSSGSRLDRAKGTAHAIGIDLGTTYSVVAYLDHQGRPISIPNVAGDILTPSVVLFDQEGTVVGKEAVLAAPLEPDKVADCVKRDMGSKHYRKPINGEHLPPEVISSYILRRLRADAERKLGPITKAVITVPAYFDETRRRATIDAGRLAGLEVLDILNEPTAAAIVYGYQEGLLDRSGQVQGDRPVRVLVYDLGGGTFDVTVVEMSGNSFKALATDGDVRLGGKDWDEKLVEIAALRCQSQHGADPRTDPSSLQELWHAAEMAKKMLTERYKATLYVNHQGKRLKVDVTREEFEEATAPLLLRTRTTAEIVVMQAGLAWSDIDKVLLVGGSTRMPAVERMLADLAQRSVDRSVSADEAVAHGAALYADLLMQKQGQGAGHTEFSLTNINSHSLGLVGVDATTGRRVNRVIIPKNTPLPHAATRRFKTFKANQPNVRICVVEGESELPEACTEVGLCVIRDLPPNLPQGWPVEVRYAYRENGQLQVAARLVGHEAKVTTEFVRDNSLSDDDLMLWAECLAGEAQRADW